MIWVIIDAEFTKAKGVNEIRYLGNLSRQRWLLDVQMQGVQDNSINNPPEYYCRKT